MNNTPKHANPLRAIGALFRQVARQAACLTACLAACLVLSACADLFTGEPANQFILHVEPPKNALCAAPRLSPLIINQPESSGDLATDRIALLFRNREVRYLADSRWDATTPRLLQRLMEDHFAASGCFAGVATSISGVESEFRLASNLQRMHMVYADENSPPTAEISLVATIVNTHSGAIVGQKQFQATAPATANTRDAMLDAMENATGKMLADCASWTIEQLSRVKKAR